MFVVESRVYGTTDGPCKSSSLYRGGVKGDDPEAEMFVPPDEIMNMTNARRLNGLKVSSADTLNAPLNLILPLAKKKICSYELTVNYVK